MDNVFDKKLKVPDDAAIKIALSDLPDYVEHVFFIIRVDDLNATAEPY